MTLIILLYVAVEVLFRFIPIRLLAASLARNGFPKTDALERATTIIFEDPVYSTAICILIGFMGLLIVCLLVGVIERSRFTWKTVGLDWKRNSLGIILFGAVLAVFLFIASILTGYALDSTGFPLISPGIEVSVPVILQIFVLYLARAFGEEIVFRGYVQRRFVERYGAIWGILITAVVFVLLHQISYSLSPVLILSGVMLWTAIGALYYLSKSLYLVIIFHGVMNTLMNTFDARFDDIDSMIVHALALSLVIVVALMKSRAAGIRTDPSGVEHE